MIKNKYVIGILIALIVFVVQAFSVPHVSMTWDEPSSFFFGRANLKFWITRDRGYLNEVTDSSRFANDPFHYIYGEDIYPPFPFVVASATSYVLAERMHVLNSIDAHHLGLVVLGALGVFAMYGIGLVMGFTPVVAGGVALLYATYPTIVAQMRNDAKDVPLMSMIVVFMFFMAKWVEAHKTHVINKRVLYGFLAAISLGLAEGTKVSAAIMVPIIGVWFICSSILSQKFRQWMTPLWQRGIEGIILGGLAFLVFLISWPWLWDDPFHKLQSVWEFFKTVGFMLPTLYLGTIYKAGLDLPWHYPLGILIFQTPPTVLLVGGLGVIGVIWEIVRKRNPWALLILLWIVIGMGRFFLPGVLIYAKIRHFIDVMPAFFLGIGVFLNSIERLGRLGRFGRLGKLGGWGILGVLIVHQLWIMVTFFPYEPSYFNFLIGGSRTVAERHLFDIEYWASGVKEAMQYIDKNAQKPVTVYPCMMGHIAQFYQTETTRVSKAQGRAQYTIVPNSYSWFDGAVRFMEATHKRVYTVRRGGADLFYVYEHVNSFLWRCGNETKSVYEY